MTESTEVHEKGILLSVDDTGEGRVRLVGTLDISTVEAVEGTLEEAAQRSPLLRLDLSELEFMDSSGVRLVLQLVKRQRAQGGDAILEGPAPAVRRLFEVLGLERSGINIVWEIQ